MTRYDYPIHPLAMLFPDLGEKEYADLRSDIEKNGQLDPIIISREHMLLDGRHRMRICRELNITPRTLFFDDLPFIGKTTEADFIWSKNFLRRQLTDDQRAMLVVQWSNSDRQAAKEQQKRKPTSVLAESPKQKPMNTRKTLAKRANVTEHKVRKAENVKKRNPKLASIVTAGEMSLKEAQAVVTAEMTKLPPRICTDLSHDLLYKAQHIVNAAADAVALLATNKSEYPRDDNPKHWTLLDLATERLQTALETLNRSE